MTRAQKIWFASGLWLFLIPGVFLLAIVAFGSTLICSKCGYENAEGNEVCVHCKAELPVSEARKESEVQSDHASEHAGKLEYPDSKIVEKETEIGLEYLRKGDVEVARLFFKNAAALNLLTEPEVEKERADLSASGPSLPLGQGRSERILQFMKRCETGDRTVQRKCSVCDGTGKRTMKVTSLQGDVTYRNAYGMACPECGGSGYVRVAGTIDEWKYNRGRAVSLYTILQQGRKFTRVGGAWVPWEIEKKLSVRQNVMLKRAMAEPCSECMGFGCIDCDKCDGTGDVKCSNSKCISGMVEVKKSGMLLPGLTHTEKCKICGGRGIIACSKCKGKGNILCDKCNGTGERPVCTKCGGQGLMTCSRCKGLGVYKKQVCPDCKGDGTAICSSCNGDGMKR